MISYHTLLREGKKRLEDAGYSEQSAQLLMAELCNQAGINLYMEMDNPVNETLQSDYLEAVHRMELQEPMAYILGYEWFYGYDFYVNPDVLIPRPETEELVALVLASYDEVFGSRKVDVFDVATGSGAIGISLKLEENNMQVTASDLSKEALDMARKNAEHLQADVKFLQGSMLEPFIENQLKCDILVCNPPYIPASETLEASVADYEPHLALFGGEDGLKFYRDVLENAHLVLKDKAILAFEIGYDQGQRLQKLAEQFFPDAEIEIRKDLHHLDRMLLIKTKEGK